MKKIILLLLVCFISTANLSANQYADKCDSLQGSWTWNGDVNQWQCTNLTDTAKETYASYITAETNTSLSEAQPAVSQNNENSDPLTLKKAVAYAAMPVVVAGAVVAAIVISPVILVKKLFGD
ncbi:MAG: hypothetical protein Q8R86_12435 [Sulfuricurvum sp.]|nr:hypothetical protein [Sulfuricurvum sp.]